MTDLTPEKRAELRRLAEAATPTGLAGQVRISDVVLADLAFRKKADAATVLSLLDALDAKDADFKRMAYLGNLARSRTTEEQDELAALVRKAAK